MAEILVTWYSRSGSTEQAARALAQRLEADARPIVTSVPYRGARGFVRGVSDALRHRRPQIAIAADPVEYRLVVLGGPVWAGRPAAPLRTFVGRYGPRIRSLAAFCVSGGGAAHGGVFDEIADLAGHRPVATLSLSRRDVCSGRAAPALEAFADALRERLDPPTHHPGLDRQGIWGLQAPIHADRHAPHPPP